jgi:hypothetical protein
MIVCIQTTIYSASIIQLSLVKATASALIRKLTNVISSGHCPFAYEQNTYLANLTVCYDELAELMCGTLNREGILCSKCKPGYGIFLYF